MVTALKQLPLDLNHRPALGRDDFLVTGSNQDAVNWLDRWPEWPAPSLILYGPDGCGKTHLSAVLAERTKAYTIKMSGLTSHDANDWADKSETLILDNIDPWIGDREAETIIFHLYNIFKESGQTMLLTMRNAPTHTDFVIPDLASRLRAAPAAAIQAPDDSLLTAVLVKLFADRQMSLKQDVLNYILPRIERSFASARDLVEKADKAALAKKRNISIPLIREILLKDLS